VEERQAGSPVTTGNALPVKEWQTAQFYWYSGRGKYTKTYPPFRIL